MKKIFSLISLLVVLVAVPAFALSPEEITSENLVAILSDNGYTAYVDEDGDTAVEDQYGMVYYMISYPEENRLWIQAGWTASDEVRSNDANRMVNECNSSLFLIRCFYDSMYRTFYCDYDLYYPESGLDDGFLISIIEEFFSQADLYTDYLIGEGAL